VENIVDHPRVVGSSVGVGRSVGFRSSVDNLNFKNSGSRNLFVSCVKLVRICAGNRRACTCVKESCRLLGRRLGCTVWRDIRSWHFRSEVLRCRYWTLPRHTALRVRMAHGLFPHSHRLATWHFCLSLGLDHGDSTV
jgi:hypothetical protein